VATDKLSHVQIVKAKPRAKDYKLSDGEGMFLLVKSVKAGGNKLWRLKYRLDGRERLFAMGALADVPLAEARDRREAARQLIAKGIHPLEAKREQRALANKAAEDTFETVANAYYDNNQTAWSAQHCRDVRRILDELIAAFGERPIGAVKVDDVRGVIDAVVARNALVQARDVRMYYRQVVKHYNAQREHPIADASVLVIIPKAPQVTHHAALEPQEIPGFLRALRNSDAAPMTRIAVRMLLLSALRTTELRKAEWSEIDEKEKLWRVPQRRMKNQVAHLVPLSTQMQELIADLRLLTGTGALMFPNARDADAPMSENAIIAVLYRLGLKGRLTSHGFRSMFSSWANEHGYNADAVELQLSHVPGNMVRSAYNRAAYRAERRRLLQLWAVFIDECERTNVVALKSVA
jgi:integrase